MKKNVWSETVVHKLSGLFGVSGIITLYNVMYSNVAVMSTVDLSETQRELSEMVDLSEYPT